MRPGGVQALLVDDRPDNLVALEAILQGLPIQTVPVTSGEDALKQLLVEDFAVILLDASMPGMDGFETATRIKQRERTRHIPIIFLTAQDYDARLAFRSYQAGAVDYLTKPFDPWVLRAKVSVFVDLWIKNAELAAKAAETVAMNEAVSTALALLNGASPDPAAAAAVLREARQRVEHGRLP